VTCSFAEWPASAEHIYRLARAPNAWQFTDWANAGEDGTFPNRWDDPMGVYRVLYACRQRLGTFVETLARFRPDPLVIAGLAEIEGEDDLPGPGNLPRSWLQGRVVGEAEAEGAFAMVGHSRSLDYLREAMPASRVRYNLDDLDAASIRLSAPRRFTQEVSRVIYECSTTDDRRAFDGVYYLSRLGDDLENLAIFEPAQLTNARSETLV